MTDTVLTRENQRVGEQLLACWANELSFDILNGNLEEKQSKSKALSGGNILMCLYLLVSKYVCVPCLKELRNSV